MPGYNASVAGRLKPQATIRQLGRGTFATLALTSVVAVLAARLVAPPIVMLIASAALVTAALVLASGAWLHGSAREPRHVCLWDVAGLLMLLGFAAALVSEPLEMLQSVETAEALPPR